MCLENNLSIIFNTALNNGLIICYMMSTLFLLISSEILVNAFVDLSQVTVLLKINDTFKQFSIQRAY